MHYKVKAHFELFVLKLLQKLPPCLAMMKSYSLQLLWTSWGPV